eukprot:TRINITY_DN3383_c0_g2_i1.p1 TRINITY_DN3383_c0_g2~~TRINITY_DN3383_c0_g2_i1.p1  ORF type:complete len:274 (+),score=23.25 TRINITY_DN3383_c0_g2_i1:11-832(+)
MQVSINSIQQMEPEASSFPSVEQQLNEYRRKKKEEIEKSASDPLHTEAESLSNTETSIKPQVSLDLSEEQIKEEKEREERLLWETKQQGYKRLLEEEGIRPIQCTLYDFTKGTENYKRLQAQNFNFVPDSKIKGDAYNKDDLKALLHAITTNTNAIIRKQKLLLPAQTQDNPQYEEVKLNDTSGEYRIESTNLGNANSGSARASGLMSIRGVNRNVAAIFGIALLLSSIAGLLFLLTDFCILASYCFICNIRVRDLLWCCVFIYFNRVLNMKF